MSRSARGVVLAVVSLNVVTALLELGFAALSFPGVLLVGTLALTAKNLALSGGVVGVGLGVALLATLRLIAAFGLLRRPARARLLLIGVAAVDSVGHLVLGGLAYARDGALAAMVAAPVALNLLTVALLFTPALRHPPAD